MVQVFDLTESAWVLIANAGNGDWSIQTADWQEAAARWRDKYHASLCHEFTPGCDADRDREAAARWRDRVYPLPSQALPTIVVLCGSTRFKADFERVAGEQTVAGRIVLTVNEFGNDGHPEKAHLRPIGPEEKARLDELHKRKIDLADVVLVLNVGGYIGESTRNEIAYAQSLGKPIRYLEEVTSTTEVINGSKESTDA